MIAHNLLLTHDVLSQPAFLYRGIFSNFCANQLKSLFVPWMGVTWNDLEGFIFASYKLMGISQNFSENLYITSFSHARTAGLRIMTL